MKKISFLFLLLLPFFCMKAQVVNKEITSKVNDVTAYMNGAQITHTADVTLAKGEYNLTFNGISPSIDKNNIQVTANNDVKISSVTYLVDYLESKTVSKNVQNLTDSSKLLSRKIKTIENQLSVYVSEKELILKNNDIKSTTNGMLTSELQKAADFFRLRLNEINTYCEKLEEQKTLLNEQFNKILNQLTILNSKKGEPVYKLSVTASAKVNTTCTFIIKYLVSNAGWDAFYDIRATDVNSPVQLDYKANVYNNCGIDWSNVKLTLSTADPTSTAQRPILATWGLNYNTGDEINYEGYLNAVNVSKTENTTISTEKNNKWNSQYTNMEVSELSVDFEITTPYTIPSDNKIYFVDIQSQQLPASYKYIAVPKIDKDAFLVAYITGWESLNLLDGKANIFYAGTYIGESYINTRLANDSLEVSLGRDKKVVITRVKKQDFSGKTFIGGNKKETLSYEITVRNNNKSLIEIELQDQVPVSQENDIKVDVIETTNVTPEATNGKLIYNLKIEPSTSKIIKITFSVQYPKSKIMKLRKTRTISKSPRLMMN